MNYQGANIFLAIVEHQSITAAAKALYITQPAISAHINRLENELGVQLMIRKRGASKITLTPEGEAFIPVAKEWVAAERTLQNYKDTYQRIPFRIAGIQITHESLLPILVEKLKQRMPRLEVSLHLIPSDEMELMFKPPQFDVALRFYDYQSINATQYCFKVPFFQDQTFVLCPIDTPLPDRVLTPEDLDPAFQLRRVYMSEHMAQWHQIHFPENAISRFPAVMDLMKIHDHLKQDSRCWFFVAASISEHLMNEYPNELTLRRIEPMPPARNGNIIVSKTFFRSDILQAFYDCCREYLKERPYLINLIPDTV